MSAISLLDLAIVSEMILIVENWAARGRFRGAKFPVPHRGSKWGTALMLEVGVPLTFLLKLQLTCSLADGVRSAC
jgi:hypothetical protein